MSGRIGILVTARLGSTRLRRKHLLGVGDTTLLGVLLARIRHAFADELAAGKARIVIATTPEPENADFDAFVTADTEVFAGSRENIPLRHLECARALALAGIVSVDGDDILCAAEALRAVYDGLRAGAEGVKTEGLPFGMNAWGYATPTLAAAVEGHARDQLETGWGRIFDFSRFETRTFDIAGNSEALRFTLDYAEDYDLFRAVIEGMGPQVTAAPCEAIIAHVLDNDLTRLNRARVDEYWANFRKERDGESAPRD